MNGLELQREFVARNCEVPVVFITAHGDEAARAQAIRHETVDWLSKPFKEESLLNAIHVALDRAVK